MNSFQSPNSEVAPMKQVGPISGAVANSIPAGQNLRSMSAVVAGRTNAGKTSWLCGLPFEGPDWRQFGKINEKVNTTDEEVSFEIAIGSDGKVFLCDSEGMNDPSRILECLVEQYGDYPKTDEIRKFLQTLSKEEDSKRDALIIESLGNKDLVLFIFDARYDPRECLDEFRLVRKLNPNVIVLLNHSRNIAAEVEEEWRMAFAQEGQRNVVVYDAFERCIDCDKKLLLAIENVFLSDRNTHRKEDISCLWKEILRRRESQLDKACLSAADFLVNLATVKRFQKDVCQEDLGNLKEKWSQELHNLRIKEYKKTCDNLLVTFQVLEYLRQIVLPEQNIKEQSPALFRRKSWLHNREQLDIKDNTGLKPFIAHMKAVAKDTAADYIPGVRKARKARHFLRNLKDSTPREKKALGIVGVVGLAGAVTTVAFDVIFMATTGIPMATVIIASACVVSPVVFGKICTTVLKTIYDEKTGELCMAVDEGDWKLRARELIGLIRIFVRRGAANKEPISEDRLNEEKKRINNLELDVLLNELKKIGDNMAYCMWNSVENSVDMVSRRMVVESVRQRFRALIEYCD